MLRERGYTKSPEKLNRKEGKKKEKRLICILSETWPRRPVELCVVPQALQTDYLFNSDLRGLSWCRAEISICLPIKHAGDNNLSHEGTWLLFPVDIYPRVGERRSAWRFVNIKVHGFEPLWEPEALGFRSVVYWFSEIKANLAVWIYWWGPQSSVAHRGCSFQS